MPRLSKIGAAALAAFGWTSGAGVTASYLVVAGGGGSAVGGGGAGGFQTGTTSLNPTLSYSVTVGAGGSGALAVGGTTTQGGNSVFNSVTSIGGGLGAAYTNPGTVGGNGGSGGGGSVGFNQGTNVAGGTGTVGQGNDGGASLANSAASGGGGGANAAGSISTGAWPSTGLGGAGGNGTASSISGSSVTYAGGGAGGTLGGANSGVSGGTGGGGNSGQTRDSNGFSGTANLGGGGGGANFYTGTPATSGGNGGSGVVIISYVGAQQFGGGIVTSSGGNTIHTFTTSGTLSPLSSLTANFLVVAGGGGGGAYNGGGGGAGGLRSSVTNTGGGGSLESTLTIDTNSIYTVTVGAGGSGQVTSTQSVAGSNSSFLSITSTGGGKGGGYTGSFYSASTGGSGGGAPYAAGGPGAAGTANQGFAGGNGDGSTNSGGGGGAGAVGGNATASVGGNGGVGVAVAISGTSTFYAGGGGGAGYPAGGGSAGSGGNGGGGNGGANSSGTAGTANRGGGGGGSQDANNPPNNPGGNGGSGVVIISYAGSTQQMAGGTVTVAGGNVIHTFTSSGYLTPIVLVNNSLRFRSSASARLTRTYTATGNTQKFTGSVWVKRGTLGASQTFFGAQNTGAATWDYFNFNSSDQIQLFIDPGTTPYNVITSSVFRDPSAWYHVVFAVDTTQATASNRVRIYVNGVEQPLGTNTIPQNYNLRFNVAGNTAGIGTQVNYVLTTGPVTVLDGYLAEVYWVDGQQLTANSFGTSNGLGVWQPIRYGGSYGTNGFYLPFPSSSVTANYLVVAGGGGGGGGNSDRNGGGGGGGYQTSTLSINTGTSYTVTVGAGGAQNVAGNNSIFSSITSIGGGEGGAGNEVGGSGGSGGGGTSDGSRTGGAGTAGQGNAGGQGWDPQSISGSGGGAGFAGKGGSGATNLSGGDGLASSISGSSTYYAGGGGGGKDSTQAWAGGLGGGGAGTNYPPSGLTGGAGTPNTGGGGGASTAGTGGQGGSGIVIISYAGSAQFTGGTITSSGGNTIHTFTSSGTLGSNIAADYSPNGNNWTPNNISLTAGSTYDSMTDVPTLTSATAGNYCTWNPLDQLDGSLANGNLSSTTGTVGGSNCRGTFAMSSGKWYFECTPTTNGGIASIGISIFPGSDAKQGSIYVYQADDGNKYSPSGGSQSFGSTYTTNDVIGVAVDMTAGYIWWAKNGTWQASGDPATGANPALTGLTGNAFTYLTDRNVGATCTVALNAGQQPFSYTPPTGFNRLNTFNLPTPTIGATASTTANKYMDATTYTGNGGTQSVTNSGSMQPDFLWIKPRSTANSHVWSDSVRGTDSNGYLFLSSDSTAAESTFNTAWHNSFGKVTALNSNGFTVVDGSSSGNVNTSAVTYVGWQWKANGAGSSNTDGSITSTVSANTTAGFSIVGFNSGAAGNRTVGHGLGVTPSVVIMKSRQDADYNWAIYHSSVCNTTSKFLPFTTSGLVTYNTVWGAALPTSTVFGITSGNGNGGIFNNTNCIAYCFAPVAGYSAFGSYTGNGSTDGPFVFLGFRPRFIMIKRTTNDDPWIIHDTARDIYNGYSVQLYPNSANAEGGPYSPPILDELSNGFKCRSSASGTNGSGDTFIYMAFAESPFKYANAR